MSTHNNHYVTLSQKALHALSADISQRQHIEACGVLLGSIDDLGNWQVDAVYPLPNIFDSAVYFEFDPEDLLNVELLYPGKIIGVYHSHPTGFARASDTDRQNMQRVNEEERIPWAWLIVCGPFNTDTLYPLAFSQRIIAYHHFDDSGLQRLPLHIEKLTDEAISKV